MTPPGHSEAKSNRVTRTIALLCFVLAGALLIMSLVQATTAGAGQARYGIQLPESRVMSVKKSAQQSRAASLGALLAGSATR